MTSYQRGDVVLVIVPFSDFSQWKARPAVVVGASCPCQAAPDRPDASASPRLRVNQLVPDTKRGTLIGAYDLIAAATVLLPQARPGRHASSGGPPHRCVKQGGAVMKM